jgi:mannosyltransferase OCH1-like enzyme
MTKITNFYTIFGLWDTIIPISLKEIQNRNASLNFKMNVLGKEDVIKLISQDTDMIKIYDSIPRKVCQADIARLYIMKEYDGYYCDMDILLRSDMNVFLTKGIDKNLYLFCEHDNCNPAHMGIRENKAHTRRIFNCIFGSTNKENNRLFWDKCISLCKIRSRVLLNIGPQYEWTDSDVIWATGPDVITTVYHELKDDLTMCVVSRKESDDYFQHYATGTWRNSKDAVY